MKKRDIITLIVLGIIFGIMFLILFITKDEKEEEIDNTEFKDLTLLTDEITFLSIERNINKMYSYVNSNSQALNFIVKNDIDSNEYKNMSFKTERIYVVSNSNLYKYYIKGTLHEEIMDEPQKFIKQEYLILNYDIETSAYNIEIIDRERYDNAKQEEYIFESISINDYNKFEYSSLSPKSRAIMYFNDFVNKMYNAPEEAYNLLSNSTKQKYFNNYEDFENFILNHDNISVTEYSINNDTIGIKDNYNIEYIIEPTYILNYNVTINMTEE